MNYTSSKINWKRNLFFVWLSQFLSLAGFGFCMPFIPLFIKDVLLICDNRTRGIYISVFSFAGMLSLCASNIVWGTLADRWGRKLMLLRASYGAALLYPCLVFAPNIYVLIVIRFFVSFFSGTMNPAQALMASTAPESKQGFVQGTLSSALWTGNVVGGLAGGLIVFYYGYTVAFLSCGIMYLASGLLVHIFVKDDFDRTRVRLHRLKQKQSQTNTVSALMTPTVILILLLFVGMGFSRRIETPFVPELVLLIEGPEKAVLYTGIISAITALGGVLSGLLLGYLCDHLSARVIFIPILVISGFMSFTQALSPNIIVLITARFLLYFTAGGIQPILQAMLVRLSRPELRGTYFGWGSSCSVAGGIIGALLSGLIVSVLPPASTSDGLIKSSNMLGYELVAPYCGTRHIFTSSGLVFWLMIPLALWCFRLAAKKNIKLDPDLNCQIPINSTRNQS